MDTLRSSMETLSCGQGTRRRDVVSPVSAGLPPLFTMSPVFGLGPCRKQQHGWIWFHSFSQSKQTQTASPTVSAWGAPGQVGRLHPSMDAARSQPRARLCAPGFTRHVPALGPGTGSSLHPAGGRRQPVSPRGRGSQGCRAARTRMKPPFVWYRQDRNQRRV